MKDTITKKVHIAAPDGIIISPIILEVTYPDMDLPKEDTDPNCVSFTLNYNGAVYRGEGKDFLRTDALADLQMRLPDGVLLCCCLTCRHGNMCPFGNKPDLLRCTKDITIKSKNDLISVFDSKSCEYAKRDVSSFGYCDSFANQNDAFYTYNDYGYYLSEMKKKVVL